jgi:hypothetical protein
MSKYYLHFERFNDNSLLHVGVCDEDEKIKIFDVVQYENNLLQLSEDLLLYVSKNRTQNANLYFHNYKDDLRLMNKFLRKIQRFIIKADDNGGQDNGNNSGFTTINLIDSREIINKDLKDFDEEFDLDVKNESVVNQSFFTQDNYNKSVPISEYTSGLSQTEIKSFDTFIEEKQEDIKNSIDLITPPPVVDETQLTITPLPINIPTNEVEPQFYIIKENLLLAATSDNFTFNPTNILIESTSTNTLLLKKGLDKTL